MALFPAFVDLSDKEVLVVGGGRVARRKIEKLIPFTKNISVVAKRINPEVMDLALEHGINVHERYFRMQDLKGKDLVVVAVDNINLQKRIFNWCNKRGVLCNSVDSPEYCNFIFPALIKRGDVVIGISTGGKVPALARRLRELIETCLPEDLEEILDILERERSKLPKGKARQEFILERVRDLIHIDKDGS